MRLFVVGRLELIRLAEPPGPMVGRSGGSCSEGLGLFAATRDDREGARLAEFDGIATLVDHRNDVRCATLSVGI